MTDPLEKELNYFSSDLGKIRPRQDGKDRIWHFYTHLDKGPPRARWHELTITEYEKKFYLSWCNFLFWSNKVISVEFDSKGRTRASLQEDEQAYLINVLKAIRRDIVEIEKDWLGFYKDTLRKLPHSLRFGIVRRCVLWKIIKDMYRPDHLLGKTSTDKFVHFVQTQKWDESEGHFTEMTLKTYYKYCRIAYLANSSEYNKYINRKMSGAEMYKRMADGRNEGLTDIESDSPKAFENWYGSRRFGGHPWEICRGGNSTHIDLGIIKRSKGWSIYLEGSSTSRMVETARMALAFYQHRLPFELHCAEKMRLKFLGDDNVGITPTYLRGSYNYQEFTEADKVFDCACLDDFEENRRRLLPFISWKQIAPLLPWGFF
ncbi:MAG: hypothetical protein HY537_04525 [Deltaproteobacteria bacterium]|nr:hypothetical protein [Deltaproteobacteria bacterium]